MTALMRVSCLMWSCLSLILSLRAHIAQIDDRAPQNNEKQECAHRRRQPKIAEAGRVVIQFQRGGIRHITGAAACSQENQLELLNTAYERQNEQQLDLAHNHGDVDAKEAIPPRRPIYTRGIK